MFTFWTIALSILALIALTVLLLQARADYYLERAPDTDESFLRFTRIARLHRRAIQAMYIYVALLVIVTFVEVVFFNGSFLPSAT